MEEREKVQREAAADVEAHKLHRANEEAEEDDAKREDDEPDVEAHKFHR
jgi:hypothetical protein